MQYNHNVLRTKEFIRKAFKINLLIWSIMICVKYLHEFIILCVHNALCAIRSSVQCTMYNIVVCAIRCVQYDRVQTKL